MRMTWCFCLIVLMTTGAHALSDSEFSVLASEADTFTSKAERLPVGSEEARELFTKSILRYERILRESPVAYPYVRYNLGNLYVRTEDYARALHHYLKATPASKFEHIIFHNISYVVSTLESKGARVIDLEQTTWPILPVRLLIFVFALTYLGWWGLLFTRAKNKRLQVITSSVMVLSLGGIIFDYYTNVVPNYAVVISPKTDARLGDGEHFAPAFNQPLAYGSTFEFQELRGQWIRGQFVKGQDFWVTRDSVIF